MNRKINEIIESMETEVLKFVPNEEFYKSIGINRKRWGMIFKHSTIPTLPELQKIANYFKVDITELVKNSN